MHVDIGLGRDSGLLAAEEMSLALEDAGYDAMWTAETDHDPFLPLAVAADRTTRIGLGTSIAVAFARTPMTVANLGWDLQEYSRGRLLVGLGTQVKAHITRRYAMEWSRPAARMREYVLAVRAIWDGWLTEAPLRFEGEFYSHTLMTPFFAPDRGVIAEVGLPKIYLAGVGPRMTEVAGEVADGFICHGFTTERFLREVTLPALDRGLARAGRDRSEIAIVGPPFVVTGSTEEELALAAARTRRQLAFYGSTPAYRRVLELHGWNDVGDELHRLSRQGDWAAMTDLVSDEMLEAFAVIAPLDALADRLLARYGDVVTRIRLSMASGVGADHWVSVMDALRDG